MRKNLNFLLPTWDFFKKHEGCGEDKNIYACIYSPYGPLALVEKLISDEGDIDGDYTIRLTVVDESFEIWKQGSTAEQINDFLNDYADSLPNDEFVKMFKKHGLKEGYRLNLLGVRLLFSEKPFKYRNFLSKQTHKELCRYFEGIFGTGNVCIRNQFMTAPEILDNLDKIYQEAICYMKDKKKFVLNQKEEVTHDLPFVDLYLPVITKYEIKNPLMSMDEYRFDIEMQKMNVNYYPCLFSLTESLLKMCNFSTTETFDESNACRCMLKELKNNAKSMLNQLIPDYYLPEFHDLQMEEWAKFIEQLKNEK